MARSKALNSDISKFERIKHKITVALCYKKVQSKRKNYMYADNYDEVKMQKIYHPDYRFYFELLAIPAIAVVAVIVLTILKKLEMTIGSIIIGLLGSYIASVVVSLLVDLNSCKVKTMERMRFQHVYCYNLYDTCNRFIYCQMHYLAETFSDECETKMSEGKFYDKFIGFPWQYWLDFFNDIFCSTYPFDVASAEGDDPWITVDSKYYSGEEYAKVKPKIEAVAMQFIQSYITQGSDDTLLDQITATIRTYRSSLSVVYTNDNISDDQLKDVNKLLDNFERLSNCVKNQKYIDFWHITYMILNDINILTYSIYPFRFVRENEHIYQFVINGPKNARLHYRLLTEYINDDDNPQYKLVKRSEYRRIKKQMKINEMFNKELSAPSWGGDSQFYP